ncbi:MAG: ATP-dependent Clp protease ATP-binding subunit [Actinobacteria bacterium]|nr:ATP-dependent Clp protease ATP-binding subunit [Actinomycetota bacterium]MBO0787565.1 ATP-dependent Clp protease ATP-binding subunit [Actinomycetota bacterium]
MIVSQQLSDQADHLIGHFVDGARRSGASWSAIGEAMGVTKQAAQKRFVPSLAGFGIDAPPFSRFTLRARNAVGAARAEARGLGSPELRTEHLLLGLLTEPDGLAAKAIVALGADPDQVRDQLGAPRSAPPAGPGDSSRDRIPVSAQVKRALELTLQQALALGHNYIGTEHLLLGLIAEQGTAAQALARLGITAERAREWVTGAIAETIASQAGQ